MLTTNLRFHFNLGTVTAYIGECFEWFLLVGHTSGVEVG